MEYACKIQCNAKPIPIASIVRIIAITASFLPRRLLFTTAIKPVSEHGKATSKPNSMQNELSPDSNENNEINANTRPIIAPVENFNAEPVSSNHDSPRCTS